MRANPHVREVLIFGAVGVAATGTHAAAALIAHNLGGLSALGANLVGYLAAVLVSYLGNAWFTFGKPARYAGQFARFLAVSLLALGMNQLIVYYCTSLLGWPFTLTLGLVVVLVPIFSFLMAKLWAFAGTTPSSR